jgi:hypothetical protein
MFGADYVRPPEKEPNCAFLSAFHLDNTIKVCVQRKLSHKQNNTGYAMRINLQSAAASYDVRKNDDTGLLIVVGLEVLLEAVV